jgi:hypothetical protein
MTHTTDFRKIDRDPNWRKREESFTEIVRKYPTVSPFVITQIDVQRRGVFYTDAALRRLDPDIHQVSKPHFAIYEGRGVPTSLLLRDGTSIIVSETSTQTPRDPYTVDVADGKLVLTDEARIVEEVFFWEKPKFFEKTTSRGTPMREVLDARPQRFSVSMSNYCHFWTTPGHGCKYCGIGAGGVKCKGTDGERVHLGDLRETARELVKEQGRFVGVILTGGSIISGSEPFEDELNGYIDALKVLGEVFETRKFPSQVNSSAFTRKQLERLYNETGITGYTTDLEVFHEEIYKWICPGKAANIPYGEWKRRLFDAVEIFGKGQVNTGIVSGVELAEPNGFKSEDEALRVDLEEAEDLASHGVGLKHDVWNVVPGSIFWNRTTPSLDYYVRLTKGFYDIMRKYDIPSHMDSYRKCGMHPNVNHDRI